MVVVVVIVVRRRIVLLTLNFQIFLHPHFKKKPALKKQNAILVGTVLANPELSNSALDL